MTEVEEELKILLLPKDPNDDKNIIIELRAGTGGDEAAIFVSEMFRMYSALRRDSTNGRSRSSPRRRPASAAA